MLQPGVGEDMYIKKGVEGLLLTKLPRLVTEHLKDIKTQNRMIGSSIFF